MKKIETPIEFFKLLFDFSSDSESLDDYQMIKEIYEELIALRLYKELMQLKAYKELRENEK